MACSSCTKYGGPIFINGFLGDAVFRSSQCVSTISRRLCDGLDIKTEVNELGEELVVYPMIRIGDKGHEEKYQMRILEYAIQGCTEFNTGQYEVVFGSGFLDDMDITFDNSLAIASSPIFGDLYLNCDSENTFLRSDFRSTDYERNLDGRVILLFDMDCFEVQVHEKPHQIGHPRVVVNSSDRVLAVSYEAKLEGISRQTTPYLRDALNIYPDLIIIRVPIRKSKFKRGRPRPDTRIARLATARIMNAIKSAIPESSIFELSSGDEFYVDITAYVNQQQDEESLLTQMDGLWPKTFLYNGAVIGAPTDNYVQYRLKTLNRKKRYSPLDWQEIRLIYGSTVASSVVQEILDQTGYQSSVGVGSKKLIAKMASGIHKPGSITIFAPSGLKKFAPFVKMEDIPGLGGKTGALIKDILGVTDMEDMQNVSFEDLTDIVSEKKATEILNNAFGVDDESVEQKESFQTSSTTRKLHGHNFSVAQMKNILLEQIVESLENWKLEMNQNSRIPKKIKMNITVSEGENFHSTVVMDNGKTLPNEKQLFEWLCAAIKPSFSIWDSDSGVENLQIIANF